MNYIHKLLNKIGLNEGETKIYLAGLKLGSSKASDLSKETEISRPLVYHILKQLEEKGLTAKSGTKHNQKFSMEPPNRLDYILERKINELRIVKTQLDDISAILESIHKPKSRPANIRFFEGTEALKNIARDTLNTQEKEIRSLVPIENIFTLFDGLFLRYWSGERKKRNIKSRSIYSENKNIPFTKTDLQKIRIAPKDMNIESTIIMYDNTVVVFSSPKEPFAFVIENEAYSNTMKSIFDKAWSSI